MSIAEPLYMPRTRADLSNTALRIFLQEMGAAYDEERSLTPYSDSKNFRDVREFFDERCCYCGAVFSDAPAVQDHLIPMNKKSLGLHAWGNVVPACGPCNAKKQGREWHAYLADLSRPETAERYQRISQFFAKYKYAPDTNKFRGIADELYAEVGTIAMTLIRLKVERLRHSI